MDGIIPTGAGNSRIAALRARKRPQVDINEYGIGVEGGPDGVMLTNRVDSLSDQALSGIQQRGFGSGREAAREAMDAAGRTYRTNRIGQNLELAQEERKMDYALADEDALEAQRRGNAVNALKTRGDVDIWNDPGVRRIRNSEEARKLELAQAGQEGAIARAMADARKAEATENVAMTAADAAEERARIEAASREGAARIGAGSEAIDTLMERRDAIPAAIPERHPSMFQRWAMGLGNFILPKEAQWGYQAGSDPHAARRQRLDASIDAINEGMGFAQRPNQPGVLDAAETPGGPTAAAADAEAQAQQAQIAAFAQQSGIAPAVAARILRKYGMIR